MAPRGLQPGLRHGSPPSPRNRTYLELSKEPSPSREGARNDIGRRNGERGETSSQDKTKKYRHPPTTPQDDLDKGAWLRNRSSGLRPK
eukprot:5063237-Amphidinium_carterae.1